MGSGDWLLLVALSLIWGGSFLFAELALEELPPFTVVLGRVGIAALALNLLVVLLGERMPAPAQWRIWGALLVMGAINNAIPFSLIVWGQTEITGGLASILNATTPLFAVMVAHVLTGDEKLTVRRFAGVVAGFLGVVLMIGPAALAGLGAEALAQLAVLTAALSYSLASVFGRRFSGLPPVIAATGQVTCSSLTMIPIVMLVDRPWTLSMPGIDTWSALLGLALGSTALAYILYFKILARAGATNLMLVTFLIPISALVLGMAVLGETIDRHQIGGMILIGSGLALIDGRPIARARAWLPHRSASVDR